MYFNLLLIQLSQTYQSNTFNNGIIAQYTTGCHPAPVDHHLRALVKYLRRRMVLFERA